MINRILLLIKNKRFITVVVLIMINIIIIDFCDIKIEYSSKNKIFKSIKNIPNNKVALVLGTIKYINGM